MISINKNLPINQKIRLPNIDNNEIEFFMKREDQIHPVVNGNKFRKLKYNLDYLKKNNKTQLVTFGGAFSNHLLACSYIGSKHNIKTLGIVRGEELNDKKLNSNLIQCKKYGMNFKFVSRSNYKKRNEKKYLNSLEKEFENSVIIPEGGTNFFGVKGSEEILNEDDKIFDTICCPVGTGGTISGLINSKNKNQFVLGFSALKSSKIKNVITKFVNNKSWFVFDDSIFGGYAKIDNRLVSFINQFTFENGIILDPIYNSKMLYYICEMIKKNKWSYGKKILLINTGGSTYINDINLKLKKQGCLTIDY